MSSYSLREILKKGESDRDGGGYMSTCDGILCYRLDMYSALLLNPSTRKFIILPPLESPDQKHNRILYTLVYDRFINSYKIIVLNARSTVNEVHTLVLGTNYWRKIDQDFPSSISEVMCTSTGIFMNDSVNWLTSHFIVSLDLEKESYQKFSLPVSNEDFISSCLGGTLGTLRGCLSLLISMKDNFTDVWIMKEFGNKKSWTKLLSIPYMKAWGNFRFSKVLYISEDGQVLMEMYIKTVDHRLVIYDSINNTFNFPEFQYKIPDKMVAVYVESLIDVT
jgi:F-box interacting protein